MANILVIDDNSSVRRVIGYTLRKHGHSVTTAEDAFEGLSLLSGTPDIDLLILDVAMPKMDGLTLLRKLRHDDRYHRLPVIMLTASCDDQDHLTARAEGADDYLNKPASSHELIEAVSKILAIQERHLA